MRGLRGWIAPSGGYSGVTPESKGGKVTAEIREWMADGIESGGWRFRSTGVVVTWGGC